MDIKQFIGQLNNIGVEFFTGVPDSQLKSLCNYLMDTHGVSDNHVIAANEGNAVAIAAGYHLATGKIPLVYLQNSGIGNIINPVVSLTNERVYAIPTIFVIGWRGEPGIHDEPQHLFQGDITLDLLNDIGIDFMVLEKDSSEEELNKKIANFQENLEAGESIAFIVKKGSLEYNNKILYQNSHNLRREDILEEILNFTKDDIVVSTTGKTSREVFETRERRGESHERDFLTVGSMGHSSSIAMGIALKKNNKRIWCIDGDGAALMHLGSMAVIGSKGLENFVHILVNNESHESVGGQPTVANKINFCEIATGCAYRSVFATESLEDLIDILHRIKDQDGPIFIEVKSAIGSREDLGRPSSTPLENKTSLMKYLQES